MKTKLIISATILVTLLISRNISVFSQETDLFKSNNLKDYVGFWETILPDSSILTFDIKLTILDKGIYSVGKIKNKQGNLFYQADALWTYNPKSNILVMYEINSDDVPMTHSGKLLSPTKIFVERFDGSGTVIQQSVIELKDKNTLSLIFTSFESGKSNKTEWILKRRE